MLALLDKLAAWTGAEPANAQIVDIASTGLRVQP